jgi:hypothetical protein
VGTHWQQEVTEEEEEEEVNCHSWGTHLSAEMEPKHCILSLFISLFQFVTRAHLPDSDF